MKKMLLSLAMLVAGAWSVASAETVTLSAADASDFVGTYNEATEKAAASYQPLESCKIGDFSFTFVPYGTGTWNDNQKPAWYDVLATSTSPKTIRLYSGANRTAQMTLTAPEGATMTSVEVVYQRTASNSTLTANSGKVDNAVWTGSANSVMFMLNSTDGKSANVQIKEFNVTYEAPAAPTLGFELTPQEGTVKAQDLKKIQLKFKDTDEVVLSPMAYFGFAGKGDVVGNYFPEATLEGKTIVLTLSDNDIAKINENPGTYTLSTFPGMGYTINGENNPAIEINYTVEAGAVNPPITGNYSFVPASGQTVADLNNIKVSVEGHPLTGYATGYASGKTILRNTTTGVDYPAKTWSFADGVATLVFSDNFTQVNVPGEYTLTIPEGAFYYGEDASWGIDKGDSPAMTASYTIASATADPVDFSVIDMQPDDEMISDGMWNEQVVVGMTVAGNVETNASATTPITMTLNGADLGNKLLPGSEYLQIAGAEPMDDEAETSSMIQLVFVPERAAMVYGAYKMTVPAGFFNINGAPNKEYSYTWNIKDPNAPATGAWQLNPQSGATTDNLNSVKVKFDNATAMPQYAVMAGKQAILANTATEQQYTCGNYQFEVAEDGWITLNFEGTLTPGSYTLAIPEGMFLLNGQDSFEAMDGDSPEVSASYTLTAAAPVIAADTVVSSIMPDDNEEGMSADEIWSGAESVAVMFTVESTAAVSPAANFTTPITMTLDGEEYASVLYQPELGDMNPVRVDAGASPLAEGDEAETVMSGVSILFKQLAEGEAPKAGTYVMTIPEGFFMIGDAKLGEYTRSWTIEADFTGEYRVSPAADGTAVSAVTDLLVEFHKGQTVAFTGDKANVRIEGPEGATAAPFGVEILQDRIVDFFLNPGLGEGQWTVTVPANSITVDGTPYASEIKWSFNVAIPTADKPVILPGEGNITTDEAASFRLVFPEGSVLALGDDPFVALVDTTNPMAPQITYRVALKGTNEIEFTAYEGVEIPESSYKLTVYGGTYTVDGKSNGLLEYSYNITKPVKPSVEFAFTPAEGAEVEPSEALDIVLTVNNAETVAVDGQATLTSGSQEVKVTGVAAAGKVTYMLLNELTPGQWTMTIPANTLTIDGEVYAEPISWTFTVKGALLPEAVINPAEGIVAPGQLENITLTYPEGTVLALGDFPTILLQKDMNVRGFNATVEGNVLKLSIMEGTALEAGEYTLDIFGGAFTINGTACPQLTFHYTVDPSSVSSIGIDENAQFNVYTVEGIVVLRNAKAADLDELPAGLYIVNGKKVIIRK